MMGSGASFLAGSIVAKMILDKTAFSSSVKSVNEDIRKIGDSASATNTKWQGFMNSLNATGEKLSAIGRTLTVAVTTPLLGIGTAAAKMAIDTVEAENLLDVTFGKMADSIREWSNELSTSLGLNRYEVRETTGVFFEMLQGMGITKDAAYDMSKQLALLGYDLASFRNLKPEVAFEKIQSAIVGMPRPMQNLGYVINETTTKTWALKNGLIGVGDEMTEQQKILARYNVMMEVTKNAHGDLARTLDSPANQLRILKSRLQETAVTMGMELLPMVSDVLGGLNKLAKGFSELDPTTRSTIINFGLMAAAAGPIIGILGKIATAISNLNIVAVASKAGIILLFVEIAKYAAILKETSAALQYVTEATERQRLAEENLQDILAKVAVQAGLKYGEMAKLIEAHKGNVVALVEDIKHNREGKELYEAFTEVMKTHKRAQTGVTEETENLASATGDLNRETSKLVETFVPLKRNTELWQRAMFEAGVDIHLLGAEIGKTAIPRARELGLVLLKMGLDAEIAGAKIGETLIPEIQEFSERGKMVSAVLKDVGYSTEDLSKKTADSTKEMSSRWDDLVRDITQTWASSFQGMVEGTKSFRDFLKDTWGSIKQVFFRMVADMATKWISGFLTEILMKKTATAAADAASSFSSMASSAASSVGTIGSAVSGVATSIGTLISSLATAVGTGIAAIASGIATAVVALATGIATAATTLAAAAPALLVVGAIALAIYAGFSAINALLASGGGGAGDGMGRVVERQDRFLAGWEWWYIDVVEILAYLQGQSDSLVSNLQEIRDTIVGGGGGGGNKDDQIIEVGWRIHDRVAEVAKAISKLSGAQHGHVSRQTELLMVHGTPAVPEITIPANRLGDISLATGGGRSVNLNFAATFEIDAVDGASVRDIVRAKIGPEIVAWIRANIGKREFREALGV